MNKENISTESPEESVDEDRSLGIYDIADSLLRTLLRKHKNISIIIADRDGHCINSTLPKLQAFEQSSCVLDFTDKVKVLLRKVLPDEELTFVRIRGRTNEIVVTFDDEMEIITIQHDEKESLHI